MEDLVKTLNERRLNLVHEMRNILDERADENGVLPAEHEETYQKMADQATELGNRVKELVSIAKQNKNIEEYREEYESLVSPEVRKAKKQKEENALRAFMSGKTDKLVLDGFQNITRHVDARTGRYDIKAALGEDASGAGGNTVPTDFLNSLYQHLIETAAIRQTNVRILPTSNGRSIQLPKTSSHGTAVWVGEGTAITGSDPSFGQLTLDAWKVAQLVRVSNELLDDTGVDLTGYLAEDLGRGIGQAEGERFVVGSGTNTPRGVMVAVAADAGTAVQVASATVETDNLIDLMYSVGRPYRARGFWLMADSTEKAIMKLKNADDQYVWRPGLQADVPATILGRPVVVDPFASAIGSANESVAFGDFGGFVIREDGNPEIARSSERYFDTDEQAWRVTHRVDSDLLDTNAIAVLDTD